jgi:hypothetical protein
MSTPAAVLMTSASHDIFRCLLAKPQLFEPNSSQYPKQSYRFHVAASSDYASNYIATHRYYI